MYRGVIAAGSEQSAAAGAEAFDLGGNAVDAAVAAAFATASGDPAITSLAGGGILLYRDGAAGRVHTCDFFANAPGIGGRRSTGAPPDSLAPLDFVPLRVEFESGAATQTFHVGRAAAAVPGVLPGLCMARERWGRLPLAALVAPAVRFLREGIALTPYQVNCNGVLLDILRRSSLGRELFLDENGNPSAAGHRFRNERLAATLERLAEEGLERLLEDLLIPVMIEEFGEERGGWITRDDLVRYRPEFPRPAEAIYRGARVTTGTARSFGGPFVALTLELFRRARLEETAPTADDRFLRLACVFRAVSETRVVVPDLARRSDAPEIVWQRVRELLEGSRSPRRSGERRQPGNTTHISTIDRDGNAASLTLSYGEGNGHAIGDTGILMNNLLGEADLFPQGFNRFEPGERLMTMMAPTLLEEPSGTVTALGSGGSNRIRTVIAQVISALLDDGARPQEAVNRARIHFEDGVLSAETYLLDDYERALSAASDLAAEHRYFERPSLFFGGAHLARRTAEGRLEAVGDPRRAGTVRTGSGRDPDGMWKRE